MAHVLRQAQDDKKDFYFFNFFWKGFMKNKKWSLSPDSSGNPFWAGFAPKDYNE